MTDGELAKISLGYVPRAWQAEARRAFKRFNVLIVHRRGGKSVLAIKTLVDAALRTEKQSARYAYIAPLRTQAKAVAWDYLKGDARLIPGCMINESELHVTFPNGSQVRLYGADNPDSLRGLYLDGVAIDEVADMKPQTWDEVLRPALADRLGWALFIGTVKGFNLLSKVYYQAVRDPEWYAGLYTVDDTSALTVEEVEAMRASMPPNLFAQELMCDFGAGTDNQLITLEQVVASQARAPRIEQYSFAAKIIGVDVARYGSDQSVIFRRQGLMSWAPMVFQDIDNMSLAAEVIRNLEDFEADAVFVDAGRGEGVIDRMRMLGYEPIPVDFGGTKGVTPGYLNKRSEMWGRMAEWIQDAGCIPMDQGLASDLVVPVYSHDNPHGKMELESKKLIKKRGLPSPDKADGLALTFAFPVSPRETREGMLESYGRRPSVAEFEDPWKEEE